MERKIFFEDARKKVLEMFSYEFPTLPIQHIDLFEIEIKKYDITNFLA